MEAKHTVHTDALETLGNIIGDGEKRDAIHLAVEPATAVGILLPGQNIGPVEGGYGHSDNPVGIVDPFLKVKVRDGQKFWLLVYPRQITSLRHVWSHPAFAEAEVYAEPQKTDKSASEAWLRNFFQNIYGDYEEGIQAAKDAQRDHYLNFGTSNGGDVPTEFWMHFENVTGLKATYRSDCFSCAC